MRQIKFRGKRKDNGEWIYGDLLHFGKNTEILRDIPIGMNESIKVIPETVGQYTGSKDRDGKEIYEGDKIERSNQELEYYVEWHDKGWWIKGINNSNHYSGWLTADYCVVGNIHEN